MKKFKKLIMVVTMVAMLITSMPVHADAASKKAVTVSINHVQVKKGSKTKVKAKLNNAKAKSVSYKSSNTKIATVSSKGVVKGKKKGTARITATIKGTDGKTYTRSSSVRVYNKKSEKKKKFSGEKGHYVNVTRKHKATKTETVVVEPATTKRVYQYTEYRFPADGFVTTDEEECDEHAWYLVDQEIDENYFIKDVYKTVKVPAVTKKVTKSYYKTTVVGRKYVIDKKGSWK